MTGDRILKINHFKLFYDGLFSIEFEDSNVKYRIQLYLTPQMLFRIMHNEFLEKIDSIQLLDFYSEGVNFTKTILVLEVFDENDGKIVFLTSEEAEHFQPGYYLCHCEIEGEE